jgi:DNA-binding transcriptional MerR regulator
MTEGKTLAEIFGLGSPIKAIKQLRDESGASLQDARAALKDADFDVELALQLLKDRGQWETPESRKVQIAQHLEFLEEHKQSLRERFEEEMAFADREIGRARKTLQTIQELQTRS